MTTILIVDDEPANRNYLTTVLGDRGWTLLEARDGMQALELAMAAPPDLVISDILMPGLDGYSLLRRLADDERFAGTRVILHSAAYQEHEAQELLREYRATRFLGKPSDPEAVLAAVKAALGEAAPRAQPGRDRDVDELHVQLVSAKLYEKFGELQRLQRELEQRVIDRTRQLECEAMRREQAEHSLRQANERLQQAALRDSLTGLHNRRHLDATLRREVARARRHERPLSALLIDVDHLKRCNDTFGHAAGDALLCAVSEQLRRVVRAEDTVCRYGGDEFVVLMPDTTPAAARACADRLRSRLHALAVAVDGTALPAITLSIGIAGLTGAHADGDALLRSADRALYRVKAAGRDRAGLASDFGDVEPLAARPGVTAA